MRAYWAFGIVLAAGLRAQAQDCIVNVYVEQGVPMPVGMLLDAKTKSTQMLGVIGVQVRMRNGIPAHAPHNSCGAPIVVQIENSDGYRGGSDSLAHAAPFKKDGTCIHVFIDRVMGKLSHEVSFRSALLSHVMVHEIAHVLEEIDRHSAEGVMKAVWSEHDYESMRRHPLPFAPEDVDLIHRGLVRRISTAAAE